MVSADERPDWLQAGADVLIVTTSRAPRSVVAVRRGTVGRIYAQTFKVGDQSFWVSGGEEKTDRMSWARYDVAIPAIGPEADLARARLAVTRAAKAVDDAAGAFGRAWSEAEALELLGATEAYVDASDLVARLERDQAGVTS